MNTPQRGGFSPAILALLRHLHPKIATNRVIRSHTTHMTARFSAYTCVYSDNARQLYCSVFPAFVNIVPSCLHMRNWVSSVKRVRFRRTHGCGSREIEAVVDPSANRQHRVGAMERSRFRSEEHTSEL